MSQYDPRDMRYVPDAPAPVPEPVPASAPAAAPTERVMQISKPASVNDAYDGGLKVLRDTTGLSGGTQGHVNTPLYTFVIAGKDVTAFEWANVTKLDNYAQAGENVAHYAQANKHGDGPTWGAVSEACDTEGKPGLLVPHEFDTWATGADNGLRPGVWSVLGDARKIRGLGPSGQPVGGSSAFTAEAMPNTFWTRGMRFIGRYLLGIDFSTAEEIRTGTVIRMKAGQAIAFDQYDSFTLREQDGRMQFCAYGRPVFEIDMATGETYRLGVRQG